MHVVDALVLDQIGADVRSAAHDAEEPRLDERREGPLVHRDHRILRRIDLQQDHPVVGEQLVQHVEHGDRGDVAGSEDQADPSAAAGGSLPQAGRLAGFGDRDSGREPDFTRVAGDDHFVGRVQRKRVGPDAPTGGGIHSHAIQGVAAGRQRLERLPVRVQCHQGRVRTGKPLLPAARVPRLHAGRERGGVGPLLRRGDGGGVRAPDQPCPLAESEVRP